MIDQTETKIIQKISKKFVLTFRSPMAAAKYVENRLLLLPTIQMNVCASLATE